MSLEDIKNKLEDNLSLTDAEIDEIIVNSTDSSWANVKTQFLAQVNQFKIADEAAKVVAYEIQQNNPTLSEDDISKIIENADGFDKILLEQGKRVPGSLSAQYSEILSLTAVAIGATINVGAANGMDSVETGSRTISQGTAKAIRAALNKSPIPPDAQPRQFKETLTDGQIKQCILLANIDTVADFYHEALAYDYDGFKHHGSTPSSHTPAANYNYRSSHERAFGCNLYGRSIVPLNLENPELFMKFLTSPNNSNQYLHGHNTREKYLNKTRNFMQLCFVKNIEDGRSLRPFEFPFIDSEKSTPANYNFVLEYLKSLSAAAESEEESVDDDDLYRDNFEMKSPRERYLLKENARIWWSKTQATVVSDAPKNLKSIDISFDGTNPSTARNDVKVTISFDMPNLSNLTHPFNIESKQSDSGGNKKNESFRLADLVLFPSMVNNATPNTGRAFRSQYDPNHNRIRIYLNTKMLNPVTDENTFINEENRIALDLTLIDHDLKKSGDDLTTDTTFTVTYRGYAESFLSVPLMDTLVGPDVLQERINREKILETAITEGCQLSQVRRIVADLNLAAAAEAQFGSSRIIDELHKRNRIIKVDGIDAGVYDLYTVPSSTGGIWSSTTTTQAPSISAPQQNSVASSIGSNDFSIQNTNGPPTSPTRTEIYYFYLADLIDICSDNLLNKHGYEKHRFRHTDTSSEYCTNTKYNFILGTVTVPIGNEKDQTINLAQIPISVDFFKEWYKENIIDKKLTYFPIISMIRQLCERVITNMLINFCFADRLESDIIIRTAFVEDSNWKADDTVTTPGRDYCKQLVEQYFYNENNFSLTDTIPAADNNSRAISSVQPLFNHNREIGLRSSIANCDTFSNVIIYAQGKNEIYSRNFVQNAKADTSIPIIDATDKKLSFHLKSWNFSKVQQPGLREARYFNASLNQITQLTSVYDITLNFKTPLLALFPGQIILIVMKQQLGIPSNPDSLSFQLGLGGYHIITKVNHKFGDGNILDPRLETTINARWIASGAPQDILRSINPTVNIGDPTDLQKFNACNAVAEYARETSAAVVHAARIGELGTLNGLTDYADEVAALFTPPSAQAEIRAFLPADAPDWISIRMGHNYLSYGNNSTTVSGYSGVTYTMEYYESGEKKYSQIKDAEGKILGYVDEDSNFIDVPALLEEEP